MSQITDLVSNMESLNSSMCNALFRDNSIVNTFSGQNGFQTDRSTLIHSTGQIKITSFAYKFDVFIPDDTAQTSQNQFASMQTSREKSAYVAWALVVQRRKDQPGTLSFESLAGALAREKNSQQESSNLYSDKDCVIAGGLIPLRRGVREFETVCGGFKNGKRPNGDYKSIALQNGDEIQLVMLSATNLESPNISAVGVKARALGTISYITSQDQRVEASQGTDVVV